MKPSSKLLTTPFNEIASKALTIHFDRLFGFAFRLSDAAGGNMLIFGEANDNRDILYCDDEWADNLPIILDLALFFYREVVFELYY